MVPTRPRPTCRSSWSGSSTFKDEATPYTNAVLAALATGRAAVPALWPLEVANVLLMGERRERSTQAQAARWLRFLDALPIPSITGRLVWPSTRF